MLIYFMQKLLSLKYLIFGESSRTDGWENCKYEVMVQWMRFRILEGMLFPWGTSAGALEVSSCWELSVALRCINCSCAYSVGKHLHKEKSQQAHSRAHGHTGLSVYCVPEDIATKSTLQDHLNIHSGDRPYKCHCCDMDFKHKSALKKHLSSLRGRSSGEKLPRHDLERQNLL